jgi:hypothetical protein
MFNLEDIILNIFGSLVASIIFKIMDKFIDKNKESKNNYLDFSNTRQKKTLHNTNHPNTPVTYTGKRFGEHC